MVVSALIPPRQQTVSFPNWLLVTLGPAQEGVSQHPEQVLGVGGVWWTLGLRGPQLVPLALLLCGAILSTLLRSAFCGNLFSCLFFVLGSDHCFIIYIYCFIIHIYFPLHVGRVKCPPMEDELRSRACD